MIKLPTIKPVCNKCGNCCKQGGECYMRQWDQHHLPDNLKRSMKFEGKCELLLDSNLCSIMLKVDPKTLVKFVKGICDFPELKIE